MWIFPAECVRTITTGGRGDDGAPSLLESPQSSSENHQVVTTCVKDLHPIGDSPSLSDLVGPHMFLGSSGSLGEIVFSYGRTSEPSKSPTSLAAACVRVDF